MLGSFMPLTIGSETIESSGSINVNSVFNSTLFTGDGSLNYPVTTGMNLLNQPGLLMTHSRTTTSGPRWIDTVRGSSSHFRMWLQNDNYASGNTITGFTTDGFTLNTGTANSASASSVAFTWMKSRKFFDVFSYVGDGNPTQVLPHILGVTPGMVVIKILSTTGSGLSANSQPTRTYSPYFGAGVEMALNTTSAQLSSGAAVIDMDSETITVKYDSGNSNSRTNYLGVTYMAYVFADDPEPDGIIRCGTYAGNGSTQDIDLGWDEGIQYAIVKRMSSTGEWAIVDDNRGMGASDPIVRFNATSMEAGTTNVIDSTANGFSVYSTFNASAVQYFYLVVRGRP